MMKKLAHESTWGNGIIKAGAFASKPIDQNQKEISVKSKKHRIKLSPKQYAKEGGARCPFCLSEDISANEQVQMEGTVGWREIICETCSNSWEKHVVLSGYASYEE